VAPSRTVGVSASVNLPLHHKVQKFSSGIGSPGWSQKKGPKTVVVVVACIQQNVCTSVVVKIITNFRKLRKCGKLEINFITLC